MIPLVGALVLYYAWTKHMVAFSRKDMFRVWFVQTAAVLAAAFFFMDFFPLERYDLIDVPLWRIATAGLEDAVFVLPAFFIKKPWRWAFLVASSISFTLGHSYQGDVSMLAKTPYVFVTYVLAARYGIGTTIVVHSLNDLGAFAVIDFLTKLHPGDL